ncbi:MAG: site-specific integrase [Candidatus Bathyarchaeota archaeon]|nr:site-specific integrase [Candidatus Bathyarchaeota archaeon]
MVKYGYLLEDTDVKRWFSNLAAGSQITADVYLRGLGRYCELNNSSPTRILQQANTNEFRDGFLDFVRQLENQHKAGSYIIRYKKVVSSWLAYNGIQTKLKVNIKGATETPTLMNERVPMKEELAKIFRNSSQRCRVSSVMMAYCGLRPESLGDYCGKDGIRLGDFREAKITPSEIIFDKIPTLLAVRGTLSKGKHQYFTFVPQEAVTFIKEYLDARAKAGEKLAPDSPLLQIDARGNSRNLFLRTALVTREIRKAIRHSGFCWRPYVLRAYCDTAFDIAESKGLISHPWRMFFMGHKGDIESRYSCNKAKLPPDMVEEMRMSYKRTSALIQTSIIEPSTEEQVKRALKEQLLFVAGFKKAEMEKMNLEQMNAEEVQNIVRQKLLGIMSNNGSKQKVISFTDLKSYISQGFEYVASLPNGEAIIKMPF